MQKYRCLYIEPITINDDGSIDEVKMTSQGVGKPFGTGEKIMGYQACELQVKALIDKDETCGEKLPQIEKCDQALFRYVRSASPFTAIELHFLETDALEILSITLH